MENRKQYIDELADQLNAWDNELKKLEEQARMDMNMINKEFKDHLNALKRKEKKVSRKLGELVEAGEDAWDELKPGVKKSMDEFKSSMQNALAKFN